MLVPALMVELDESNVFFRQPPGEKTVRSKGSWLPCVFAVELEGALRFIREIRDLRDRPLHVEGHFVLGDPGFEGRVSCFLKLDLVKLSEVI